MQMREITASPDGETIDVAMRLHAGASTDAALRSSEARLAHIAGKR